MEEFNTEHFGILRYDAGQIIHFPAGLPAFDNERGFLPIEDPSKAPVVFLQSLSQPGLVFITLPVLAIDPTYQLMMAEDDIEALDLPVADQPKIGAEVLCLAIVTIFEDYPPTANLMAPIVVNLATKNALQAIQTESGYSHQHLLPVQKGEE